MISVALARSRGVTPTDLHRFPWATFLARADAHLALSEAGDAMAESGDPVERGGFLHELVGRHDRAVSLAAAYEAGKKPPTDPRIVRRPGRRGHPDEHYRRVAQRYLELRLAGASNPTTTIAKEHFVSRDTAAGWVRGARERGFLSAARRGRAG